MDGTRQDQFIRFLQEELGIPVSDLALALRQCDQAPGFLHMILWQYGLISLDQLARIFDWLEIT